MDMIIIRARLRTKLLRMAAGRRREGLRVRLRERDATFRDRDACRFGLRLGERRTCLRLRRDRPPEIVGWETFCPPLTRFALRFGDLARVPPSTEVPLTE